MQIKRLAVAVSAVLMLLSESQVHAAGLGKLTVQSTLGQPLNAEIEVLLADPAEFKNLQAHLGSQNAFRSANVEMTSTLESLKFNLEKRPDGSAVLHVTSDKPIRDPYLDVIVDLDWSGGEMMREYTVLLDPPGLATEENQVPVAGKPVAVTPVQPQNSQTPSVAPSSASPVARSHHHAHVAAASGKPAGEASSSGIRVKSGTTLSEIAKDHLPAGVELDQMLVGLYHANPQAFDGNMNLMKAGAILKVPDQATLTSESETDAAREVSAQTRDWHAYREKLAGMVESATSRHAGKGAVSGKVTSGVEDQSAPPPEQAANGVLKLSKGNAASASNGAVSQDQHTAASNALAEQHLRQQALEKNIADEKKLLAMKSQPVVAPTAAPPVPVTAAKPVEAPLPAATPAPVPVPPHPHPVKHPPLKFVPPPAPPEPKWYQMINPLYAAGAALVVLLGGLIVSMRRKRSSKAGLSKLENSILTSVDSKPNTVYNTQSGEAVNTNNTSFLTDFSQSGLGTLDTHDVDPIAEAEVYMAYGRDAQAEEILREAMVKEPGRHEIRLKLLEIYAGRSNLPAFENIATELFSAAGAESPVWEKAAELGRRIDPHNPLYGGSAVEETAVEPAAVEAAPLIPEIEDLHEPEMVMHAAEPEPASGTSVSGDELPEEEKLSGVMEFDMPEDSAATHHDEIQAVEPVEMHMPEASEEANGLSWDFMAVDSAEHPAEAEATSHEMAGHDSAALDDGMLSLDDALLHGAAADDEHAVDLSGQAHEAGLAVSHEIDAGLLSGHDGLADATEDSASWSSGTGAAADELDFPAVGEAHAQALESSDALHHDDMAGLSAVQDDTPGLPDHDLVSAVHDGESESDAPLTLDFSDINLDLDAKPAEAEHEIQSPAGDTLLSMPESADQMGDLEQEVRTKFELAQVYQEMGDYENAREILQEVMAEGTEQQKKDAGELLAQMPG